MDEVTRLISLKADLEGHSGVSKNTALASASSHGHLETVECLLVAKAEVDGLSGSNGYTPLMLASNRGRLACVAKLLKHKADVNRKSVAGQNTPLSLAASGTATFGTYEAVVRTLLLAKALTDVENRLKQTPLERAVIANSGNVVTEILTFEHRRQFAGVYEFVRASRIPSHPAQRLPKKAIGKIGKMLSEPVALVNKVGGAMFLWWVRFVAMQAVDVVRWCFHAWQPRADPAGDQLLLTALRKRRMKCVLPLLSAKAYTLLRGPDRQNAVELSRQINTSYGS